MGLFCSSSDPQELHGAEAGVDGAEHVTNDGSEDHESSDNNNGNQNEDQRIFNQTLAFFFRWEQHDEFLLSQKLFRKIASELMISFYVKLAKSQWFWFYNPVKEA